MTNRQYESVTLEFTAIDDEVTVTVIDGNSGGPWHQGILNPLSSHGPWSPSLTHGMQAGDSRTFKVEAKNGPGLAMLIGELTGTTGNGDKDVLLAWNEHPGHHHGSNTAFVTTTFTLTQTDDGRYEFFPAGARPVNSVIVTFNAIDDRVSVLFRGPDDSELKPVKEFTLHNNSDDRFWAYSDQDPFGLKAENDQTLKFDLSGRLQPGSNTIVIRAHNITAHGTLIGKIEADGREIERWNIDGYDTHTGDFVNDQFTFTR